MRRISLALAAPLLAGVLLTACKGKDGDPGPAGPAGPAGPSLRGSIVGFVSAYDEFGQPLVNSGTSVTLDGTNFQATTDAAGRFELADVNTGTYTLKFTRPGFPTYTRLGLIHVGGTSPTFLGNWSYPETSKTQVSNFTATVNMRSSGYSVVDMTANVTNPRSTSNLRFCMFVSDQSPVSPETGKQYFVTFSNNAGQMQGFISTDALKSLGYTAGQRLYLTLAGMPNSYAGNYNTTTGLYYYIGWGTPSNVQSVLLP